MQVWGHFPCKRYEHFLCKYGSTFYAILKASIFYAESKASIFYAWIITMRGTHATTVYMKVHILCNRGASNMYSGAFDLLLRGLCNTLSSKRAHLVHIGERWHLHVKPSGAVWTAILTWSRLTLGVEIHYTPEKRRGLRRCTWNAVSNFAKVETC